MTEVLSMSALGYMGVGGHLLNTLMSDPVMCLVLANAMQLEVEQALDQRLKCGLGLCLRQKLQMITVHRRSHPCFVNRGRFRFLGAQTQIITLFR